MWADGEQTHNGAEPLVKWARMLFGSRSVRTLWIALFLCAVVCAQAASLAFEHPHDSGHCCQLCHLGPLPFLGPAPVAGIAPVVAVAWYYGTTDTGTAHEMLLRAASSRAPPFPSSTCKQFRRSGRRARTR